MNKILSTAAALILCLGFAGAAAQATADMRGGHLSYAALSSLSVEEVASLVALREEEKLARDVYITLYQHWGHEIFLNIAVAEQSHMDAVLSLLAKYGIPDPVTQDTWGAFSDTPLGDFLSALYVDLVAHGSAPGQILTHALYAGGFIEEADILILTVALEGDPAAGIAPIIQHEDLRQVYEHLLSGSRNHLRAFAHHIESSGLDYWTAWYELGLPGYDHWLSIEAVNAILDSAMERGPYGPAGPHAEGNGKGPPHA